MLFCTLVVSYPNKEVVTYTRLGAGHAYLLKWALDVHEDIKKATKNTHYIEALTIEECVQGKEYKQTSYN